MEDITPDVWKATATNLDALFKHAGLLVDPSRTKDSASILRPPCTMNRKDIANPKPSSVKYKGHPVSFEGVDTAVKNALTGVTIGAAETNAPQRVVAINDDLITRSTSSPAEPYLYKENREDFYAALCAAYPDPLDRAKWLTGLSALAYLVIVHGWDEAEVAKIRQAWEATASIKLSASALIENDHQWQDMLNRTQDKHSRGDEGLVTHLTILKKARVAGWRPHAKETDALTEIQSKFALLSLGGKIGIINHEALDSVSDDGTAARLEVMNRMDGTLLINRYLASEFPQNDAKKLANTFLYDKKTTLYNGVEFNPRGTTAGALNLWVGSTISPKIGKCPLIYTLLHDVLCGGRESEYQYLIQFIAHALQHPWEKPGVMVILLGGQGIGKGTFARILQGIWSATFLHVHRIKQVVGDFNGSLERTFIVFLDEALFAGDRTSSDALKSLVTEQTISINEKHQPSRQIKSYHRFFSATNAEWFKSTERDDRRDFVLRVSEHRKGDFKFWDALEDEIKNGGVEALTHDLLAMDLSGFNVRNKPNTRELTEQKLQSLDKFPRWWFNCLTRGTISELSHEWPSFVGTATLLNIFKDAEKNMRSYKILIERDVVNYMGKLCPSATREQRKEHSHRMRGWCLPPLDVARKEFEKYIGDIVEWENM